MPCNVIRTLSSTFRCACVCVILYWVNNTCELRCFTSHFQFENRAHNTANHTSIPAPATHFQNSCLLNKTYMHIRFVLVFLFRVILALNENHFTHSTLMWAGKIVHFFQLHFTKKRYMKLIQYFDKHLGIVKSGKCGKSDCRRDWNSVDTSHSMIKCNKLGYWMSFTGVKWNRWIDGVFLCDLWSNAHGTHKKDIRHLFFSFYEWYSIDTVVNGFSIEIIVMKTLSNSFSFVNIPVFPPRHITNF